MGTWSALNPHSTNDAPPVLPASALEEGEQTIELDVPRAQFGVLCGSGGKTRLELQETWHVKLHVPSKWQSGRASLTGIATHCLAAKQMLERKYGVAGPDEKWDEPLL